jgi:hypothetical protein
MDNQDFVLACRETGPGPVQIALNPPDAAASQALGLSITTTNVQTMWCCPNRSGLPLFESAEGQWIIGYQYFGGITNWWPNGVAMSPMETHSPNKLSLARPSWSLAADAVIQVNGTWGAIEAGRPLVFANIPPHKASGSARPSGGNVLACDDSVEWIKFDRMFAYSTWTATRQCFWYQDPSDFSPSLRTKLTTLSATNAAFR